MNKVQIILPIAFLCLVVINTIHCRKGERFLYHPQAGWLRLLLWVWLIAMGVLAVLSSGGFIPISVSAVVVWGFIITHQIYSLVRRQRQRAHVIASA